MENLTQLLDAGLEVTLIGMGVVFVLLTALVGAVYGMSALARLIEGPPVPKVAQAITTDDEELIIVISAAIGRYRRDRLLET